MVKKSMAAVLCLSLAFTAAACGNQEDGSNAGAAGGANGKTKLTYWTADRHDVDHIKGLIEKFNADHQDIEVEMSVMSENYVQSVDLAYASGQAPDILNAKFDFVNMARKQYFEPLDGYMKDDMKKRFEGTLRDSANTYDGKIYTLPNYGTTIRLVYNKELFEKAGIANPPKTLQEMVDAAKKITEVGKKDGIYGFAENFKNPTSAMERSVRNILQVSGYGVDGYNFKTGKYDFAGYKEVITALKQMKDDGSMLPGVESMDIDPLRAQFAAGKIGMYLSYSAEIGVYQTQFPTKVQWAAADVPSIDGTVKGLNGMNGAQWMAISSSSKNKEAAWKFVEYMYSEENLVKYAETGLGMPVLQSVAEKMKTPDIYGYKDFVPTKSDAIWPVKPNVDSSLQGLKYADAFWKYILDGSGNLDTIIADLTKRYNDALDKAIKAGDVKVTPDPNFDPMKLK
ncbi:ABC transporter substrate-binding protein [Paenibacillus sp. NPDC056579]|uniref:ABC transporter substrate-binding protein n=1 Tax=Paenibacillus sp. NPDC056579 TaxID=3345871 RepID=UPI0036B8A5A6